MKKHIMVRIFAVVTISSLLLISISTILQINSAKDNFNDTSIIQLNAILDMLQKDQESIEKLEADLAEDFIGKARSAAAIVQKNPESIETLVDIQNLARILQIDEINIFTPEGEIYLGTVPEYYGYTFNSGEQMRFFLPILDDYSLEMVQDIVPNTAEQKEMQYIAVWSENREFIMQIGMEPTRLYDAMENTKIENVFSNSIVSPSDTLFVADSETGEIIASNVIGFTGETLSSIGIENLSDQHLIFKQFETEIFDEPGLAILTETIYDGQYIMLGLNKTDEAIYSQSFISIGIMIITGALIGTISIMLIYLMLDKVVLKGILSIRDGMAEIAQGDLEYKVNETSLPEFKTMSADINTMVDSILASSVRLTTIFQYVNIQIAMYECREDKVVSTGKLDEILGITAEELNELQSNPKEFVEKITTIKKSHYEDEEDLYVYYSGTNMKYLKIKAYPENNSKWGIIIDMTNEINEKQDIEHERDVDFLTGIYNRRAFFDTIKKLTENPEYIENAIVMMLDLDNLKHVNDSWGHVYGDEYVYVAAQILNQLDCTNKIVARLSGDEFILVIYAEDSTQKLEQHVAKLEEDFADAFILNPSGEKYPISISGGYTFYHDNSKNFDELIQMADQTMYQVKKDGKGSIRKFGE